MLQVIEFMAEELKKVPTCSHKVLDHKTALPVSSMNKRAAFSIFDMLPKLVEFKVTGTSVAVWQRYIPTESVRDKNSTQMTSTGTNSTTVTQHEDEAPQHNITQTTVGNGEGSSAIRSTGE
ncbi:uncharacterized protein LOC113658463 [Tachysurus ichikawai]